jgi:hypothetical protein
MRNPQTPPLKQEEKLLNGHNLVMLGHTQQTLAQQRRFKAQHDDIALTALGGKPTQGNEAGADDEMLVLGDLTVNNHIEGTPAMPSQPQPIPGQSGLGTLAKLGIGAALLASGAGAGAGIPLIVNALTQKPAIVQPPAPPAPSQPRQPRVLFNLDFGPDAPPAAQ